MLPKARERQVLDGQTQTLEADAAATRRPAAPPLDPGFSNGPAAEPRVKCMLTAVHNSQPAPSTRTQADPIDAMLNGPFSLQRYRPTIAIPQFRTPVIEEPTAAPLSKYHLPVSQWPIYRQFYQNKVNMSARLPSPSAPFHEQIKEYAHLWGVWAAEISNDEKRQQVLQFVMERMESAWRYGIDKGLYPAGEFVDGDAVQNGAGMLARAAGLSASQIAAQIINPHEGPNAREKQRKKKKLSPDDTWLFADGISTTVYCKSLRDKNSRVTLTELQGQGVSPRAIEKRVADQDLEAGNDLFDKKITELERDILKADWIDVFERTSENRLGRDLLMYALHEVQQARSETIKLENIMRGFKKSSQRANTMARVDEQKFRHDHFLALAIEISENRLVDVEHSGDPTSGLAEGGERGEEMEPLAVTSEDESESDAARHLEAAFSPTKAEAAVIDLARTVLGQSHVKDMFMAFEGRHMNETSLSRSTISGIDESPVVTKMRIILLYIVRTINKIHCLQEEASSQEADDLRRDIESTIGDAKIKITHDKQALRTELDKIETEMPLKDQPFIRPSTIRQPLLMAFQPNLMEMDDLTMTNAVEEFHQWSQRPIEQEAPTRKSETAGRTNQKRVHEEASVDKEEGPMPKLQKLLDEPFLDNAGKIAGVLRQFGNQTSHQLHVDENLAGNVSLSPSRSPSAAISPAALERRQRYRRLILLPKLNGIFREAGIMEAGQNISTFSAIKQRLIEAGIEPKERNSWAREWYNGHEAWDGNSQRGEALSDLHALNTDLKRVRPTADLLAKSTDTTAQQTGGSYVADNLNTQQNPGTTESNEGETDKTPATGIFAVPESAIDDEAETDGVLVLTTGQRRRASLLGHPLSPQPNRRIDQMFRQSKAVGDRWQTPKPSRILGFRFRPGFDPANNMNDTNVKKLKGFNFRFTTNSTIEEREQMHDGISDYVQRRSKIAMRFGSFEQFSRKGGKLVAVGFWNEKNGSHPSNSDWFFNGSFQIDDDGDIVRTDGGSLPVLEMKPRFKVISKDTEAAAGEGKKGKTQEITKDKVVMGGRGRGARGRPTRKRNTPNYVVGDDNDDDEDYMEE